MAEKEKVVVPREMLEQAVADMRSMYDDTLVEEIPTPVRRMEIYETLKKATGQPYPPRDIVSAIESMMPREVAAAWRTPRVEFLCDLDEHTDPVTCAAIHSDVVVTASLHVAAWEGLRPRGLVCTLQSINRKVAGKKAFLPEVPRMDEILISKRGSVCLHYKRGGPLYVRKTNDLSLVREQATVVWGAAIYGEMLVYVTPTDLVRAAPYSGRILQTLPLPQPVDSPVFIIIVPKRGTVITLLNVRNMVYSVSFGRSEVKGELQANAVEEVISNGTTMVYRASGRPGAALECSIWMTQYTPARTINVGCNGGSSFPVSDEIYVTTGSDFTIHDVYGGSVECKGSHLTAYKGELLVEKLDSSGNSLEIWRPQWKVNVQYV